MCPVTLESMLQQDVDSADAVKALVSEILEEFNQAQQMYPVLPDYGPVTYWAVQVLECCDVLEDPLRNDEWNGTSEREQLFYLLLQLKGMRADGLENIANGITMIHRYMLTQ